MELKPKQLKSVSANENKPGGEVILYQTEDLQTRLQVRLEGETGWLPEAYMVVGGNIRRKYLPQKFAHNLHSFQGDFDVCTTFAQTPIAHFLHKKSYPALPTNPKYVLLSQRNCGVVTGNER